MANANIEQPTIYVVGDAGSDRFVAQQQFDVPSGAFFISAVLEHVLANSVTTGPLVRIRSESDPEESSYPALPRKTAKLQKYDTVWRISRYAHDTSPSSARLSFTAPKDQLADRRLLVAHHAGRTWPSGAAGLHAAFVDRFF